MTKTGLTSIMVLARMSSVATIPRPASGISGNKFYRAFHAFEPFGVFLTITKPSVCVKETSLKVGISACFIFSLSEWPMCTDLREVTQICPNHVKGLVTAEYKLTKDSPLVTMGAY